mmetsp:Transcript_12623/g.19541  ORF Transcript_12623/g.19541 Transcript_12623/m.19541 type:complete len:116 (+) Transcript_12623:384-731(+)
MRNFKSKMLSVTLQKAGIGKHCTINPLRVVQWYYTNNLGAASISYLPRHRCTYYKRRWIRLPQSAATDPVVRLQTVWSTHPVANLQLYAKLFPSVDAGSLCDPQCRLLTHCANVP